MARKEHDNASDLASAAEARYVPGIGMCDDIEMLAALARGQLELYTRNLARLERRLAGGICVSGPRRGRPLDAKYRRRLERWRENLRRAIPATRQVLAHCDGEAAA